MTSQPANTDSNIKLAADLRRSKMLAFLRSDHIAWQDEFHPELAAGTIAWVRRLRRESDTRLKP